MDISGPSSTRRHILAFLPFPDSLPYSLPAFPAITTQENHVHQNHCLRVCLWGSRPKEEKRTRLLSAYLPSLHHGGHFSFIVSFILIASLINHSTHQGHIYTQTHRAATGHPGTQSPRGTCPRGSAGILVKGVQEPASGPTGDYSEVGSSSVVQGPLTVSSELFAALSMVGAEYPQDIPAEALGPSHCCVLLPPGLAGRAASIVSGCGLGSPSAWVQVLAVPHAGSATRHKSLKHCVLPFPHVKYGAE